MTRHLALVTSAFLLGIAAAGIVRLPVYGWLALTGLAFFLGCILTVRVREPATAALILSVSLLGAFWHSLSVFPAEMFNYLAGQEIRGQGCIISYPRQAATNTSFIISLDKLTIRGREMKGPDKLLLNVPHGPAAAEYFPGDVVEFLGFLSVPQGAGNPGQFDYRRYLANQEVFFQVRCRPEEFSLISRGRGLRSLAAFGRSRVAELLGDLLPEEEKILITGLLFGDTAGMDPGLLAACQRAGVSHLFAVSGFNVAFVLGMLWFVITPFRPSPLIRLVLALPLLLGYYFLVGWSASIVRASLMAFLVLAALALGRNKDIYTALAAAALVILIISPGELFQAGFQLSFMTTLGLAYLTPWLQERGFGKYLAPALAAQLSSIPLIAWHFNQISLVALLLNIVAAAVSGIVTVIGLAGTLLTWTVPILAGPVFLVCGLLMFCLSRLIIWSAGLNWAAVIVPTPSAVLVLSSYLTLALIPCCRRFRFLVLMAPRGWRIAACLVIGLALLIACWPPAPLLQVTFLDVGQGDSIFIRTPGGVSVLVDGGGTPDSSFPVGERVVWPFLRRQGIGCLDALVMSHNHLDHSEGLLELLAMIDVKVCYLPPAEPGNQVDKMIRDLCFEEGVQAVELTAGQKIRLEDDVEIEILHPVRGDGTRDNNHSLIMRLVYKSSSWLLTGDAEKEALEQLLNRGPDVQANILKLPHHGSISSYSPEFYREVNPRAVIASAGINQYNHPALRIVEYFRDRKVPVYSTGERGAIITESDGQVIRIEPFIREDRRRR